MAVLEKKLKGLFSTIMLNTKVVKVAEEKNGIRVTFEGEVAREGAGVRPRARVDRPPAQLEDSRARDDEGEGRRQGLHRDPTPQRRTAEPSIFAIGDVAGEPMLAHKASHEARVAVEAIAGHKAVFEPQAIPAVVFTDPEIAWCGYTEAQAKEQGLDVEIAKFPWGASGRAISIDRPDGLTKLVRREEDRADSRRRPRRLRRRRADRRGRAGDRDGRDRRGPEADDPPAPDAVGDA